MPTAAPEQIHVLTPTPVVRLAGKVAKLGSGSSAQHTCAILVDGAVQCWGSDSAGQLETAVTSVDATRFSAEPVTVAW